MSETAQTLIREALRSIGAIASGEVPTADEENDALAAMKSMLRHWSNRQIRVYSITQDTLALTGAASYTIGSGGNCNTTWPSAIAGGFVRIGGVDYNLKAIGPQRYREISLKSLGSIPTYIWYNPVYPLGVIYIYPLTSSGTAYLDSLKALSEPAAVTSDVAFPPAYDEAIKWNLALRLCPEYGKEPSALIVGLAKSALDDIETKNFAAQINEVSPEVIKLVGRYNIEEG